jgi:hypothetical protein
MNALLFTMALMCGQLPLDAEPPVPESLKKVISYSEMNDLVVIRSNVEMLQKLSKQGVSVDPDGKIMAALMDRVAKITDGKIKTIEDLMSITGGTIPPPTNLEKIKGFLTFANFVWITGVVFFMVAFMWLFGHYFLELIISVPGILWEIVLYGSCVLLLFSGTKLPEAYYMIPVISGALGLIGCLSLTCKLHCEDFENYEWFLLATAIIWGSIAIQFSSHFLGFLAVTALLGSLGFMAGHIPGIVLIGFRDEAVMPRATFAAWLILALHTSLFVTGTNAPTLEVFRDGMNFMGAFVYFMGLLIMSSRWYCVSYRGSQYEDVIATGWPLYWLIQSLALGSAFIAIFFGHTFGMSALLGISGTFLYLYVIEKYYDLPWKGIGWAWSLLGLGTLLIFGGIYLLPKLLNLI